MTLAHLTATAVKQLGTPTALLDVELLLAHILEKDRSWLRAHADDTVRDEDVTVFESYIKRRRKGEPVAYIKGTKEFYGRDFVVSPDVLVPRPETESFIDILRTMKEDTSFHGFLHQALDMGTGSGCLAITVKCELPEMVVTATDTSTDALKVAIANAKKHGASIIFKEQHLLSGDKTGYDVVLANLPYVPTDMQDKSILHEPADALFSGKDGLDHYRELFKQLTPKHIRFVMTESLTSQHSEVEHLAQKAGYTPTLTNGLVQLFTKISS